MLKILVISSCTKSKQAYPCEPIVLYLGECHQLIKDSIEIFKSKDININWKILSAGLGLLNPTGKKYAPYDITFQGKKEFDIIQMSNKLDIPNSIDETIKYYDVIIFSLSKEYLASIQFNRLRNANLNKTFIFIDSISSGRANEKIYKRINNAKVFNWVSTYPTNWGSKISFRGGILNFIANDINNINEFVSKYIKDLIFVNEFDIHEPRY